MRKVLYILQAFHFEPGSGTHGEAPEFEEVFAEPVTYVVSGDGVWSGDS